MSFSDLHLHTTFSDGKNSPEEMVEEAIRLGLSEIGFSDHAYTFFDERYCMAKAREIGRASCRERVFMMV